MDRYLVLDERKCRIRQPTPSFSLFFQVYLFVLKEQSSGFHGILLIATTDPVCLQVGPTLAMKLGKNNLLGAVLFSSLVIVHSWPMLG